MHPVKWVLKEAHLDDVQAIVQATGLPAAVARVLAVRGISPQAHALNRFLSPSLAHIPDPCAMAGVEEAAHRVVTAVERGEPIGIFGDYDVDGVTSTAILWEFLEQLGAPVTATIPDRIKEGYGLSRTGVERLQQKGVRLIITVDCGVTAHEEVDYAAELGLDVVVVDHHTVPVELPRAVAVVNPHRQDCGAQRQHLCAAGVVFYLCVAVRQLLRRRGFFADREEPNLKHLLDLVAVGTVADVVPLVAENRVFVQQGLQLIAAGRRPGLQALLEVADVQPHRVTAGTLGFHVGPRINAAGRLEDAMCAVHLLRSQDAHVARELARQLDEQNQERRAIEKMAVQEATEEISQSAEHAAAFALVVYREHWHPGVVGIVASRLVERFGKPTLVIGTKGKGSGRSIPAFHLHDALCGVRAHLLGFGGHAHAVGVHVEPAHMDAFKAAFLQQAASLLHTDDLVRHLAYDDTLTLSDITASLVTQLGYLAPFGRSNPEPTLRFNRLRLEGLRPLANNHIRGIATQQGTTLPFIGFGMQEAVMSLTGLVDVLAIPEFNEWRGERALQLRLKDIKGHGA